jgi:hypothetical protein
MHQTLDNAVFFEIEIACGGFNASPSVKHLFQTISCAVCKTAFGQLGQTYMAEHLSIRKKLASAFQAATRIEKPQQIISKLMQILKT